jgi:hypothetical protein
MHAAACGSCRSRGRPERAHRSLEHAQNACPTATTRRHSSTECYLCCRLTLLPIFPVVHINRRVLETETLAHDCGLAAAQLADLVQPTQTADGQPAAALKFGQPRVTALLNALCHFLWTADGLTNAQLRPLVASLLGTSYTTRQMGYDLRRLVRKGLIKRLDHQKRYVLTPYGRRVALFLTKVHARVLRPGLQALDLDFSPNAPPRLRTTFTALDRAIDAHISEAHIAA